MATIENINAAKLWHCTLAGKRKTYDIVNLVRTISVRESICSPFITGEILALDNDNVISGMEVEGGSPCLFHFTAPGNSREYRIDMYVVDIKGVDSPDNIGLKIYTISLVSSEYFTDQGTTVSRPSDMGMTGCQMAKSIWTECKFHEDLIQPTQDYPLRDSQQPFHVDHVKPLTAIGQIRDIQVYPDRTGNVLLYRTIEGVYHVPLYEIYTHYRWREEFIQRETWGINFLHMFGEDFADHSILFLKEHSRATMLDKHAFKKQTVRAVDNSAGKWAVNDFVGPLLGPGQNNAHTNSQRTSPQIDFSTENMDKSRCYAACLKSQPQYSVTVPLRTGINMIAGTACNLNMMPSKTAPNSPNPRTGIYLVTDLIHEVHNDLRPVQGTTILQCLLTGAQCDV